MTNKINGIDVSECEYLNKVVKEEPYCNIDEEHLCTCSSDENCYFKQLKGLQEENKRLQMLSCANCGEKYLSPEGAELYDKMLDYKDALEEIRNIAEKLITELPEYNSCYYKDECGDNCTPKKRSKVEYCCYENADKILTIINEVLEDNKDENS